MVRLTDGTIDLIDTTMHACIVNPSLCLLCIDVTVLIASDDPAWCMKNVRHPDVRLLFTDDYWKRHEVTQTQPAF